MGPSKRFRHIALSGSQFQDIGFAPEYLLFYHDGALDLPMTEPAKVVAPKVELTYFVRQQSNLSAMARKDVSTNAEARHVEPMHNVKGRQFKDDGNTSFEDDLRWRKLETPYLDRDYGFGLLCHEMQRSA
jgi:hypothetical protein